MQLAILTSADKEKHSIVELSDDVFNVELKSSLIHQVVIGYIGNGHQGTKAHKSRSDVRGGGRKPFRQKGMGRARAGTIRSPLWRSGGVTFAARPHVRRQKINKKMLKGALASIFSQLIREERLSIIQPLIFEKPKSKDVITFFEKIDLKGEKVLIITEQFDEKLALSIRNIPNIDSFDIDHIDPASLIAFDHILIYETAIKKLQERLV